MNQRRKRRIAIASAILVLTCIIAVLVYQFWPDNTDDEPNVSGRTLAGFVTEGGSPLLPAVVFSQVESQSTSNNPGQQQPSIVGGGKGADYNYYLPKPPLPYQSHGWNDLAAWPQLFVKGVRWLKLDLSVCTQAACESHSTFGNVDGRGTLNECVNNVNVSGEILNLCCICLRGDASSRPELTHSFSTGWDLIKFFDDENNQAMFIATLQGSGGPPPLPPLMIGLSFGGGVFTDVSSVGSTVSSPHPQLPAFMFSDGLLNSPLSSLLRTLLVALREVLQRRALNIRFYFDNLINEWMLNLDLGAVLSRNNNNNGGGGNTPGGGDANAQFQSMFPPDLYPAEQFIPFSPQGAGADSTTPVDALQRVRILNMDWNWLWSECGNTGEKKEMQLSNWKDVEARSTSYPFLFWALSSQSEMTTVFDLFHTCEGISPVKRSNPAFASMNMIAVSNQGPEMFEIFASTRIGRGMNQPLSMDDRWLEPLLLLIPMWRDKSKRIFKLPNMKNDFADHVGLLCVTRRRPLKNKNKLKAMRISNNKNHDEEEEAPLHHHPPRWEILVFGMTQGQHPTLDEDLQYRYYVPYLDYTRATAASIQVVSFNLIAAQAEYDANAGETTPVITSTRSPLPVALLAFSDGMLMVLRLEFDCTITVLRMWKPSALLLASPYAPNNLNSMKVNGLLSAISMCSSSSAWNAAATTKEEEADASPSNLIRDFIIAHCAVLLLYTNAQLSAPNSTAQMILVSIDDKATAGSNGILAQQSVNTGGGVIDAGASMVVQSDTMIGSTVSDLSSITTFNVILVYSRRTPLTYEQAAGGRNTVNYDVSTIHIEEGICIAEAESDDAKLMRDYFDNTESIRVANEAATAAIQENGNDGGGGRNSIPNPPTIQLLPDLRRDSERRASLYGNYFSITVTSSSSPSSSSSSSSSPVTATFNINNNNYNNDVNIVHRIGFGSAPQLSMHYHYQQQQQAAGGGRYLSYVMLVSTDGECDSGLYINNANTPRCTILFPESDTDPDVSFFQSVPFSLTYSFGLFTHWRDFLLGRNNNNNAMKINSVLSSCNSRIMHGKLEVGVSASAALYSSNIKHVRGGEERGGVVSEVGVWMIHDGAVPRRSLLSNLYCGTPVPKPGLVWDSWHLPQAEVLLATPE